MYDRAYVKDWNVPERFCLTLAGRKARSGSLFVAGTVGSVRNLYRSPVLKCLLMLLHKVLAVLTVEEYGWLSKAAVQSASNASVWRCFIKSFLCGFMVWVCCFFFRVSFKAGLCCGYLGVFM